MEVKEFIPKFPVYHKTFSMKKQSFLLAIVAIVLLTSAVPVPRHDVQPVSSAVPAPQSKVINIRVLYDDYGIRLPADRAFVVNANTVTSGRADAQGNVQLPVAVGDVIHGVFKTGGRGPWTGEVVVSQEAWDAGALLLVLTDDIIWEPHD